MLAAGGHWPALSMRICGFVGWLGCIHQRWSRACLLSARLVHMPYKPRLLHHSQALAGGVLQLVATDHASFSSAQKAVGAADFRRIPNGVHGLEERLHVVWEEMVNSGARPSFLPSHEGGRGWCRIQGVEGVCLKGARARVDG